jgi:putative ABC transport system permease protein
MINEARSNFSSQVFFTPDWDTILADRDRIWVVPQVTVRQNLALTELDYVAYYTISAMQIARGVDIEAIGQAEFDKLHGMDEPHPDDDPFFFPVFRIYGGHSDAFDVGSRTIAEGAMPVADGEVNISTDLAELNGLSIGDHITLYSPTFVNNQMGNINRELTIVGIYFDLTENEAGGFEIPPQMNPRNEVLTTLNTVLDPIGEDEAGLTVNATYYLHDPTYLDAFEHAARKIGVDEILLISTDIANFNAVVAPIEGLRSVAQTFLVIVLVLGCIILIILTSIAIRERKYEIGVLRAMGMKKRKVAAGLWAEMLIMTIACLVIGLCIGAVTSQPVSDSILASQLVNIEDDGGHITNNSHEMIEFDIGGHQDEQLTPIDSLGVSLDMITIMEIVGISISLTSFASLAAIIKITKYEPIKILMERN